MTKKKATKNFSGIAFAISFVCIVAIGITAVVLKGQEAASGRVSARVGMLDAGYRDLRAQLLAQASGPVAPPPAPASSGPIIRVRLNDAVTNPLVFRANAVNQTMASFAITNESDDAVRLKKIDLIIQPHQPMSGVKAYLAQGSEQDQIGSPATVSDQASVKEISFSKSSGISLLPHQTAVLNIVAKPLFSATQGLGKEGIVLKSVEIFGTLPFSLYGQDLSTAGGASSATSSASKLSISTSPDNVPVGYLTTGSTDQVVYKIKLTASGPEKVRVREISFRDSIENNTSGLASFVNFRLYDESNSSFAGPLNMAVSGTGTGTVGFTETGDFNIVVSTTSPRTLILKADVSNFALGGVKSGSRHTFGIPSVSAVSAFGNDSSLAVVVSGTSSGTAQTVYRTKPGLTTAVIGSTVGRARMAGDDVASLNWSSIGVSPEDSLKISTVKIKFAGALALKSGTPSFTASLIDPSMGPNANWGGSAQQTCIPSGGSCSVTFRPNAGVSRDYPKQVKLRIDSSKFGNAEATGDALSITINAASDITWTDGTSTGIVWNATEPGSAIPITIATLSYE